MAIISCLFFFDASRTLPLPHKIMIRANSTRSVLSASHELRKESSRLVLKAKAADSNSSTPKTSKKPAVNADATSFKALFTNDFYQRVARLDVFKSIAPSVSNNIEDPREKAAKAAIDDHINGIIKETGYLWAHYFGMKEVQPGLEDQGSAAAAAEECSDVEEGGDDLE